MYTVKIDGNTLHDARIEDLTINDAKLSLEVNKAGAFDFTIYPSNELYTQIKKLKSIVEVFQDNVLLFRGRVLNDTMRFDKSKDIICEGDLAYFNDSIIRPYNFTGTIEDYLQMMIDSHNTQVEVDKQFTLGNVTVTDPNDYIIRSNSNYVKTWEEINNKLIGNLGGYILVRRVSGVNYIDYLADSLYMSTQHIELGENLLDVIKETRADDIVTALIPLGAKLEDSEARLTIESVNGGLDFIHDVDAVAQYGYIFDTVTYDNVTIASNLLTKAQQDLAIRINLGVNVELKAIDLSLIENVDEIRLFEYVQVTSQPHDIDTMALITKLSIDLLNPQNNTFTFGFNYQTFTEKQIQSDKVLKEIQSDYVTNQQVTNAINTIELTPGPPTYTWIRYADDINGSGISNNPTGKAYIGFAYNKLTATESNTPGDYTWSLIKGDKGDTGVKGDTGANGQTFYTWIKYSDNADGTGLYDVPKASTLYIGIATNKTTATESTVKTDYTWSKFKGDKGDQGIQGQDGNSLYTWIKYADTPTSGMNDNPTDKKYVGFAYNKSSETESTNYADYDWQLVKGTDGINGQPGVDGKTYYNWIAYADTSTGGGISLSPTDKKYVGYAFNKEVQTPSLNASDYQWQLVKGDKGDKGDEGPQGVQGPKGDNGISQYVHIRYSANSNGNPMTTSPQATTKYIGLANTTSSTAPTGYASYTWSLIKGTDGVDGIPGQPGADGNPNYTWVKYADNELGENMSDYPSGKMYIGLAFNKLTNTESSDPLDYQWSAMYDLEALADVESRVTSAITQTAEQIRTEVSETYVSNGALDSYKNEVSTQFTQTSTDYTYLFNQLDTYIQTLDGDTQAQFIEITKYIRFVDGNIELGDSTSQIKLVLENDIIKFEQNGVPVAYIDNNTLHITDGQFLTSLRIGNFAFTPRTNGNLSFGKVV